MQTCSTGILLICLIAILSTQANKYRERCHEEYHECERRCIRARERALPCVKTCIDIHDLCVTRANQLPANYTDKDWVDYDE
ncbi:unnamed protein product [Calicophoron daubneyi]|uniref:Uncharacterized protein n=1 Tax=Calicophoron daubneyi TaxID=300641 RepID=A0AAV2T456_CALDB